MRTISYKLDDLKKVVIPIGYEGENDHTRVIIDAGEVFKQYPTAAATLKVKPPHGTIYPVVVSREGDTVIWDVKETDCASNGTGEAQFTFTENSVIVKSMVTKININRSLVATGPAPDPIEDWLDEATEVLDDLGAMDNIAKNAQASDIGKSLSPKTVVDGVVTEWQYVEQSGGTEDYTDLENKPSIAGVTLSGNKTLEDLGIAAADDLDNLADDVTDVKNAIQGIIPLEPKDIMSAQIGRNLFNKYTATEGYYVDKNTGNLVANSSYVSSDYIEVEPSTRYGCNYEGHFAWYTEEKTYISGGSETNALNSPSTAKYLRIDTTKTRLNRFMVCKGIARSENDQGFEYNVYFPWMKAKADIDAFAFEKYGAIVVNMFNKSTAEDGKYVDATNGYFIASANYFRSDYIPVEPNTEYRVSYRNRYAVYDSNYQYITGANLDNGNSYKFTTPNNAAYVVICGTPLSRKDEYVIAKTSVFPAWYESYGVIVPWIKPDVPKSKYDGKTLVCFGDSITSDGYTQFIEADTGMTAINQGYASGRYAYSSDSSQYVNAFALHNIIYAIATGDWTIPNTIIDVSKYTIQNRRLALLKTLDFDNVDFVSFAYGTNDFMSATSLDNLNDKYDTNTVKGAVRYSIKTLLTAYPHIKIIGATPIYRFWSSGGVIVSDCDSREVDGKYLKDYAEAIKEAFAECHMPCVDNLSQAGINEFNRLYYFNIDDGTHPKDSGREIIGHRIGAAILEQL